MKPYSHEVVPLMQRWPRARLLVLPAALLMLIGACAEADPTSEADDAPEPEQPADDDDEPEEEPEEASIDFSGENVTILAATSPGGGIGALAELVAAHLSKHLEGSPTVAVEYEGAGGGLVGANQFQTTEPDGLTMFISSTNTYLPQLIGDPQVRYDFMSWQVLAGDCGASASVISAETGYTGDPTEIPDLEGPLPYGMLHPLSAGGVHLYHFHLMGLPVQAVMGFDGTAATLAIEGGETSLAQGGTPGVVRNLGPAIEDGTVIPLSASPFIVDGEYARDPLVPDAPHWFELYELAYGEEPSGPEWDTLARLHAVGFGMQNGFWLHEEAPAEYVEAYQAAFESLAEDEEFLADGEDVLCGETLMTGQAVLDGAETQRSIEQEDVDRWTEVLREYGLDVTQ